MSSSPDVRAVLARLQPDQRLRLRLKDGSEVAAVYPESGRSPVRAENPARTVATDQIEEILIELSSEPPE